LLSDGSRAWFPRCFSEATTIEEQRSPIITTAQSNTSRFTNPDGWKVFARLEKPKNPQKLNFESATVEKD